MKTKRMDKYPKNNKSINVAFTDLADFKKKTEKTTKNEIG